ncbi:dihydrolipoamide acetyltransferase family protein [Marinilabiliaceae bacterium ANBcel2]|nr:dihydrolipoamide acetyltransferase family protein [Marinilabiliaceae bacterium ANBcel2]
MSTFDIVMPKMGESVEEATITNWFVKEGDQVEEDQILLEIATDKVDSEIPSPVAGVVKEIKHNVNDLVAVGEVIAIIDMEAESNGDTGEGKSVDNKSSDKGKEVDENQDKKEEVKQDKSDGGKEDYTGEKFFSPLVKSIAKEENISYAELDKIDGTGKDSRVTKNDILRYVEEKAKGKTKNNNAQSTDSKSKPESKPKSKPESDSKSEVKVTADSGDEIVEMDRMRKMIADHMVMSKRVSPHVTSVVEADVTNLVKWRSRVKDEFQNKYGDKLTFMPIFTQAVAQSLRDFPGVNVSVSDSNIIKRKDINIGIAVALPTGNLIVPVIKKADKKSLAGLAEDLNAKAEQARKNKLSPDDIQGGTFTITNFGSFRNTIGTPIINQPQVAILATGTIEKKPAVLETENGDVIAIRHKMFLSLSYDHRAVDGALGGMFLRKIADYLEEWDVNSNV